MKYILLSLIGVFICSQEIAIPYQEKVYLHTDKPFYLVGDTIWLKGYLVNAQTHKESDVQSRFLYIELINRKNKVIQRKKIKEENGHFFNFISLEKDIEEADYQIRAYTNFMRNQGEEFFFTKQIPVYANTSSLLTANIEYDSEEADGKYIVITLLRKDGTPYANSRSIVPYAILSVLTQLGVITPEEACSLPRYHDKNLYNNHHAVVGRTELAFQLEQLC